MPPLALNPNNPPLDRATCTVWRHHPSSTLMKAFNHILLLLIAAAPLQAGWFFPDPPPDRSPEYRARISSLEEQLSEQHATTDRWETATGLCAVGCVLLFVIGTALGAKTRQSYDGTRRMGRTIPTSRTTTATAANGTRHHLGQADAADGHSKLAA